MTSKVAVAFIFLASSYIISFDVANAKPDPKAVQEFNLLEHNYNRTKRQLGFVVLGGTLAGVYR